MKTQVVSAIHVPLEGFAGYTPVSFRFHIHVTKGRFPINPLADTFALAWLLVFEDLGNSSPVNGVSNGSITTFL